MTAKDWIRERGKSDERINRLFDTMGKFIYLAELLEAYAQHLATNRSEPDAFAELANQIEHTIFYREIDVLEDDIPRLKRRIANLIRSKAESGANRRVEGDNGKS